MDIDENGIAIRRFVIHVQDREALPYARRAGRMLALLWGEANKRFGTLSGGLRTSVVDVWLSRGGEAGGEQIRNNLYVYDVAAERTGIEWARELAHEYGHYLLPGASGYTDPENWSNGILGERLFLKWLGDDLNTGKLDRAEVPYITPAELADYRAKQVTPLIDRMLAKGPDPALLASRDRPAMDAFTALMLYADYVYGGAFIVNMLDYLPPGAAASVRGLDFLKAFEARASRADHLRITFPPSGEASVYLAAGSYRIGRDGLTSLQTAGWRTVHGNPGETSDIIRAHKP